ncbi:MAG: hypothetical protein K2Z80_11935 [Xanthobacteraceae bacterium]|nr:hypothetical protein [Xanthobacteraceae bacterium]
MRNQTRAWRIALAVIAGGACMLISDNWSSLRQGNLVTEADAVVGRPLTPGSVAGVARRTSRRAVRRSYYGGGYGYYRAPYNAYGYYRRY